MRFHFTRELVENKEIEVKYIPTTEVADILTKPLQKQTFTKMRGLMKLNALLLFYLIAFTCVAIPYVDGITTGNSAPILWKKGPIPLTTGYKQTHLMINFISPCVLLSNDTVHVDLVEEAWRKCDEIYQTAFLDEIETMCPRKRYTDLVVSRPTRIIPIVLGLIVLVNVVIFGMAIAGTTMSAVSLAEGRANEESLNLTGWD